MTNILSTLVLALTFLFLSSVSNKFESLEKEVVGEIELSLRDGSMCGRDKNNRLVCDSIYTFKFKTKQGKK